MVSEGIGEYHKSRAASQPALSGLLCSSFYIGARGILHNRATTLLDSREYQGFAPLAVGAFPTTSPLTWRGVVSTERAIDELDVPFMPGEVFDPDRAVPHNKPDESPALELASSASTARAFLAFARFPSRVSTPPMLARVCASAITIRIQRQVARQPRRRNRRHFHRPNCRSDGLLQRGGTRRVVVHGESRDRFTWQPQVETRSAKRCRAAPPRPKRRARLRCRESLETPEPHLHTSPRKILPGSSAARARAESPQSTSARNLEHTLRQHERFERKWRRQHGRQKRAQRKHCYPPSPANFLRFPFCVPVNTLRRLFSRASRAGCIPRAIP